MNLRFLYSEIYSKVKRNGILQCKPAVIHFDGYRVGDVHQQTLVSHKNSFMLCMRTYSVNVNLAVKSVIYSSHCSESSMLLGITNRCTSFHQLLRTSASSTINRFARTSTCSSHYRSLPMILLTEE